MSAVPLGAWTMRPHRAALSLALSPAVYDPVGPLVRLRALPHFPEAARRLRAAGCPRHRDLARAQAHRAVCPHAYQHSQEDIAAGGAKRDLALAKVAVGTGISATIFLMTAAGQITGGGPVDDSAKRLLQANGWQPYSLKIGGRYYSY